MSMPELKIVIVWILVSFDCIMLLVFIGLSTRRIWRLYEDYLYTMTEKERFRYGID